MQRGAEEAAKALNVDLTVQAAERETDVDKQMQIIENLIQAKVDALAVTPSGSREVVPAIGKANLANIPVVVVDTRLDGKAAADAGVKTVGFVGSDNYPRRATHRRVPREGVRRKGEGRHPRRHCRARDG